MSNQTNTTGAAFDTEAFQAGIQRTLNAQLGLPMGPTGCLKLKAELEALCQQHVGTSRPWAVDVRPNRLRDGYEINIYDPTLLNHPALTSPAPPAGPGISNGQLPVAEYDMSPAGIQAQAQAELLRWQRLALTAADMLYNVLLSNDTQRANPLLAGVLRGMVTLHGPEGLTPYAAGTTTETLAQIEQDWPHPRTNQP